MAKLRTPLIVLAVTLALAGVVMLFTSFGFVRSLATVVLAGACCVFVGHVVVLDEDLPRGWGYQEGDEKRSLKVLAIKALVLAAVASVYFVVFGFG